MPASIGRHYPSGPYLGSGDFILLFLGLLLGVHARFLCFSGLAFP
jgi:hypothetical protein